MENQCGLVCKIESFVQSHIVWISILLAVNIGFYIYKRRK